MHTPKGSKGKLKEKVKQRYKTDDKPEAKKNKAGTQRTHKDPDEPMKSIGNTDLNTLRRMNK